jgi:LCP family protein required for cell wall assembly
MSEETPKPPSRARVWAKRSIIAFLVVSNLGVFYVYWQLRSIDEVVQRTAQTVPDLIPQLTPTVPDSTDPITFLLVGSDSRANLADLEGFGEAGGERSDVLMLVKLYPDEGRAQMLSLPRDLWVEIPGHGESKINAAYGLGGAQLVIETVKEATGVDINHYVEIDFVGFQSIVDQLGGVTIDFPYPARDVKSDLDVEAGPQLLDGAMALAFARSRSYQELRDGGWVSVDADDFGRTARQQQLILAILDQMRRPSSLGEASDIVGSFTEYVSMDEALADASMIELAFRMRGIRSGGIETATLPGVTDQIAGQSVVLPEEPAASQMLTAFRSGGSLAGGETVAVDPAEGSDPLSLVVQNGNGEDGNATEWSRVLADAGFVIAGVEDAESTDHAETLVTVRAGDEDRGAWVVDTLGFGRVDVGTVPGDADAVVVLGADASVVAG